VGIPVPQGSRVGIPVPQGSRVGIPVPRGSRVEIPAPQKIPVPLGSRVEIPVPQQIRVPQKIPGPPRGTRSGARCGGGASAAAPAGLREAEAREVPRVDRSGLPQNPESPEVAGWPPVAAKGQGVEGSRGQAEGTEGQRDAGTGGSSGEGITGRDTRATGITGR